MWRPPDVSLEERGVVVLELACAFVQSWSCRDEQAGMRPLTPGTLHTEPETSIESLLFPFSAGFRSEGVNGSSFWERRGDQQRLELLKTVRIFLVRAPAGRERHRNPLCGTRGSCLSWISFRCHHFCVSINAEYSQRNPGTSVLDVLCVQAELTGPEGDCAPQAGHGALARCKCQTCLERRNCLGTVETQHLVAGKRNRRTSSLKFPVFSSLMHFLKWLGFVKTSR